MEGVNHVTDIADLVMFEANEAELIYVCHALEHFPRPQVLDILKEWRRVLQPGGTLRLSVSDFSVLADLYVNHGVSLLRLRGPLMGRQDYLMNTHYTVWDYELLSWTLGEAGYYNIQRWDPYETHPVGYDDYSFAKVNSRLISLNVEATAS